MDYIYLKFVRHPLTGVVIARIYAQMVLDSETGKRTIRLRTVRYR